MPEPTPVDAPDSPMEVSNDAPDPPYRILDELPASERRPYGGTWSRRRPPAGSTGLLGRILLSASALSLLGLVLWVKQGLVLEWMREALRHILPDSWFVLGNTTGEAGLRGFAVVVAVLGFLVPTVIRFTLLLTAYRAQRSASKPLAFGLTLVRVLVVAEALAIWFRAGYLADPRELDREPFGAPPGSWPWHLTTWVPWVVFVVVVLSMTSHSTTRAMRRFT